MGVNIPRRGRGAAARSRPVPATLRFSHVGHACAFEWLGGVPRECVYENLRAVVARLRVRLLVWSRRPAPARPLRLLRDRVSAGDAAREGLGRSGIRYLKTGFWPARRFAELRELDAQYADWRDRTVIGVRTRPLALPSPSGSRRSEQGCGRYRRCASTGPDIARRGCRSTATCATAAARAIGRLSDWGTSASKLRFNRDQVWIVHRGAEVARYPAQLRARHLAADANRATRAPAAPAAPVNARVAYGLQ